MLPEIRARLPADIEQCTTYVEPFVGAGAVLFHLLDNYEFENFHIADINPELILCYRTLQSSAPVVITHLQALVEAYPTDTEERKDFYYAVRQEWNDSVPLLNELSNDDQALRVAQTLFLNKTCFNGLFRVNSKGEFNVPTGRYVNPSFPTEESLLEVQEALQEVTIHLVSFEKCIEWVDENTFVYFDPPYRPLSKTSHFVSYSKGDFNDDDQKRLAALFCTLDGMGAQLLLSNSDPKNTVPEDDFFDDLYRGFNIQRVSAKRAINSRGDRRGSINELLVTNYGSQMIHGVQLTKTQQECVVAMNAHQGDVYSAAVSTGRSIPNIRGHLRKARTNGAQFPWRMTHLTAKHCTLWEQVMDDGNTVGYVRGDRHGPLDLRVLDMPPNGHISRAPAPSHIGWLTDLLLKSAHLNAQGRPLDPLIDFFDWAISQYNSSQAWQNKNEQINYSGIVPPSILVGLTNLPGFTADHLCTLIDIFSKTEKLGPGGSGTVAYRFLELLNAARDWLDRGAVWNEVYSLLRVASAR